MSKEELGDALKPFSTVIIGILFAGNIFFVNRLVGNMEAMGTSIAQLSIEVAVLKAKLEEKNTCSTEYSRESLVKS